MTARPGYWCLPCYNGTHRCLGPVTVGGRRVACGCTPCPGPRPELPLARNELDFYQHHYQRIS